ncbi:hypothetical protein CTA2_6013 [Colletotrichum tanaceti]|uniref:Uncharacterized protein n=1 Tax=Colletotrichum tanaceti TaxID=1306861 RepID=A0A4U6XJ73_9PEZI|nr:hypothetical protein CTA2_6013 [Colletotrichum tanaceti]TKW55452.1 hypothetical protein CTA1_9483 [Colletotrichum tanaceti]
MTNTQSAKALAIKDKWMRRYDAKHPETGRPIIQEVWIEFANRVINQDRVANYGLRLIEFKSAIIHMLSEQTSAGGLIPASHADYKNIAKSFKTNEQISYAAAWRVVIRIKGESRKYYKTMTQRDVIQAMGRVAIALNDGNIPFNNDIETIKNTTIFKDFQADKTGIAPTVDRPKVTIPQPPLPQLPPPPPPPSGPQDTTKTDEPTDPYLQFNDFNEDLDIEEARIMEQFFKQDMNTQTGNSALFPKRLRTSSPDIATHGSSALSYHDNFNTPTKLGTATPALTPARPSLFQTATTVSFDTTQKRCHRAHQSVQNAMAELSRVFPEHEINARMLEFISMRSFTSPPISVNDYITHVYDSTY